MQEAAESAWQSHPVQCLRQVWLSARANSVETWGCALPARDGSQQSSQWLPCMSRRRATHELDAALAAAPATCVKMLGGMER